MLAGIVSLPFLFQSSEPSTYLRNIVKVLQADWPANRTVNIVCHGHSVPAGYVRTPVVDSLSAYPHLFRESLAHRSPHAVINVIVTAIGGEESASGARRFAEDVLAKKPDVVTIDYSLNDRRLGLSEARKAWVSMIEAAQKAKVKVILLTPTPDQGSKLDNPDDPLNLHAEQVRSLAKEFRVGLVDSLAEFKKAIKGGRPLPSLMSQSNHPNRAGHLLVAEELQRWFPKQ